MRRRQELPAALVRLRWWRSATLNRVAREKNMKGPAPEDPVACQGSDHRRQANAVSGPLFRTIACTGAWRGVIGRAAAAVGRNLSESWYGVAIEPTLPGKDGQRVGSETSVGLSVPRVAGG